MEKHEYQVIVAWDDFGLDFSSYEDFDSVDECWEYIKNDLKGFYNYEEANKYIDEKENYQSDHDFSYISFNHLGARAYNGEFSVEYLIARTINE